MMMHRRTMLAGGAALFAPGLAVAADLVADIKSRGELVAATEMEFPPFDFLQDGEYAGMDRELIDAVAHDMGVRAKYLDLPWTSVLPGLEAKKFDICIAPVTVTAERLKRYAFTSPIADATVALMKRADDGSIAKPADIAGKTIGGQKGTAQVAQLQAFAKTLPSPITVREFVDNNQSFADLAAGRLDAAVGSLPNLAWAASQRKDTFAVVLPPFGRPSYFGWVTRLEDRGLADAITAVFGRMQDDGRFAAIQKRWFGIAAPVPRSVPTPDV